MVNPGGVGRPGEGHLGEAGALAAEQVLHGAVALGGAVPPGVDVASRRSMGTARRRLDLAHGVGSSGRSKEVGLPPATASHFKVISRRSYHSEPSGPLAGCPDMMPPVPPSGGWDATGHRAAVGHRRPWRRWSWRAAPMPASAAPPARAATDDPGTRRRQPRCNVDSPVSSSRPPTTCCTIDTTSGQHPPVTLPHDPDLDRGPTPRPAVAPEVPAAALRDGAACTAGRTPARPGIATAHWRSCAPGSRPTHGAHPASAFGLEGPGHRVAGDDPRVHRGTGVAEALAGCAPSQLHGAVLADPAFYVRTGNHALNQSIGLLDVGCYLGRTDWQGIASRRIDALRHPGHRQAGGLGGAGDQVRPLRLRPVHAAPRPPAGLRPAGTGRASDASSGSPTSWHRPPAPTGTTRPSATRTTGAGRPSRARPRSTPRAWARRARPRPRPSPRSVGATCSGGPAGAGDGRAFGDETFFSLRFGPGLQHHGHDDGGALTLYRTRRPAAGRPRLRRPEQLHLASVLRVPRGARRGGRRRAPVRPQAPEPAPTERHHGPLGGPGGPGRGRIPGVTMRRRVMFSRRLGYIVVEDTMRAATAHTYRQLWHLTEDARPFTSERRTWTRRAAGNLLIWQLGGGVATQDAHGRAVTHPGLDLPVVRAARSGAGHRAAAEWPAGPVPDAAGALRRGYRHESTAGHGERPGGDLAWLLDDRGYRRRRRSRSGRRERSLAITDSADDRHGRPALGVTPVRASTRRWCHHRPHERPVRPRSLHVHPAAVGPAPVARGRPPRRERRPDPAPTDARMRSAIWEVDPAGAAAPRRLTRSAPGESSASFAPRRVAAVHVRRGRTRTGHPTTSSDTEPIGLWSLPPDGGEARLLIAPAAASAASRPPASADVVVVRVPVHPGTTHPRGGRRARDDAHQGRRVGAAVRGLSHPLLGPLPGTPRGPPVPAGPRRRRRRRPAGAPGPDTGRGTGAGRDRLRRAARRHRRGHRLDALAGPGPSDPGPGAHRCRDAHPARAHARWRLVPRAPGVAGRPLGRGGPGRPGRARDRLRLDALAHRPRERRRAAT